MKTLYKVTVTTTLYVLADDPSDAESEGRYSAREESDNADADAREVKPGAALAGVWTRSCLPYGGDDESERTIGEILDAMANTPKADERQMDLPGQTTASVKP